VLQQHSQAAHAQPFSKKVDPKIFVQTFLGGGFNPQNPPSGYGPESSSVTKKRDINHLLYFTLVGTAVAFYV